MKCLNTITLLKGIEITGVLTAPRVFNISYSQGEVTNVLHADFHGVCGRLEIPVVELKGKMNSPDTIDAIRSWSPELILVSGWYHMVPKRILEIATRGVVGLHASLLPLYRGGAPLVWAMINGENETGISLFYLDEGVDTGDIIAQKTITIRFEDTIQAVYKKTEDAGVGIIEEMVPLIAESRAPRSKQPEPPLGHKVSWPHRSPKDGLVDWDRPSFELYNFIRAQTRPYPGAFTMFNGEKLTAWRAGIVEYSGGKRPGEVVDVIDDGDRRGVVVTTCDRSFAILLCDVDFKGSTMNAVDFATSQGVEKGTFFGNDT